MSDFLQDFLSDKAVNSQFRTGDIPNLDLYMDQIIGFINANFAPEEGEKDRLLTKTMIHNYSKEGLIKPVKGKKYSKEHIIQMILVYQLKNTLKINDIKSTLQAVYSWEEYSDNFLAQCYDKHVEQQESSTQSTIDYIKDIVAGGDIDLSNKEEAFVMLLNMASLSYSFKCLTEALVDYISDRKDSQEKK